MALQAADIADLLLTTQKELGRLKVADIGSSLQDFVALPQLLRRERVDFGGGTSHLIHTVTAYANNTRAVGLFAVDNINQNDGMKDGDVPWRHVTTGLTFDERQIAMNSEPYKIVDFYQKLRLQMLGEWAEKWEEFFWGGPDDATDNVTPFGLLRYWLAYNASEGFYGGNHSNFTGGPAGIDCGTYTRWKHWTFNYTTISKTDFVRKARKAMRYCQFKSPSVALGVRTVQDNAIGGVRYGMYTVYDNVAKMEEILESQNDNLGNDVASKDGLVLFRRIPVMDVPYLTENYPNAKPFIGLNWQHLYCAALRGWFMRETAPHAAAGQHTVVQEELDTSCNVCMNNRRVHFMGAVADPMTTP
jgi:hypothetical protein